MTLDEARQKEQEWFAASKYVGDGNRLGAGALTEALTELLSSQIHAALPDIMQEITTKLESAERELLTLGEAPPDTLSTCRANAGGIVRTWAESLRKVARQADYSELGAGDERRRLVLYERQMRKVFGDDVRATRPGSDGKDDRFDVKVTVAGTKYKVGDIVKGRFWTTPKSITKVEEPMSGNPEFKKGKIIKLARYFRGDLAERIEASRGRELAGFMNFG